jgi:hypothetical protein
LSHIFLIIYFPTGKVSDLLLITQEQRDFMGDEMWVAGNEPRAGSFELRGADFFCLFESLI